MGVEFAPEKVLFNSCSMEPPLPMEKMGAKEPTIMETPMGTEPAMHTRNTINTSNAAIMPVLLRLHRLRRPLRRHQPWFARWC